MIFITISAKIFKKDLIDELLSDVDISKNKLLDICGNDIIDSQIIYENADNIVRKLFVKILERKDDIELNWMKNVLTKCKDLENRCIDAFLHFKDCIKNESLKDLETNIENIIQEIAILANVKILKDSNKKV